MPLNEATNIGQIEMNKLHESQFWPRWRYTMPWVARNEAHGCLSLKLSDDVQI